MQMLANKHDNKATSHLPVDALGHLLLVHLHQLEDDVGGALGALKGAAISALQGALSALDGGVKGHEVNL
jgi:hypothetical protein